MLLPWLCCYHGQIRLLGSPVCPTRTRCAFGIHGNLLKQRVLNSNFKKINNSESQYMIAVTDFLMPSSLRHTEGLEGSVERRESLPNMQEQVGKILGFAIEHLCQFFIIITQMSVLNNMTFTLWKFCYLQNYKEYLHGA